ncbi:MAG TPA: hypothetical protein VGK18_04125 [Propionicimonas sp.]|jgi:hypothetical protein|uniref:hypothetical protein n=1 Tax=Propionicimonas sp. TaxID=1955623 RepID=UPI002F4242A6
MPRRVGLPGASELFRETSGPDFVRDDDGDGSGPRTTGRIRHEEKITVYVSSDELLALEQARLTLRAHHRMAVDRGRIVRTAIALAMADLEARGADSDLVRGLGEP